MAGFHAAWVLWIYTGLGCVTITSVQGCGQPVVSNRIVGGQDAPEGAWPWQVSLRIDDQHICGATLISASWVLTASHCYTGLEYTLSQYTACMGDYKLSYTSGHEVCSAIKRKITYPGFTTAGDPGDIMLMELSTPVQFTDYIMPACLPASDAQFPSGENCSTTGWGNIYSQVSLPYPQTLQQVMVPIIDRATCDTLYHIGSGVSSYSTKILSDMICAGYKSGGKDSCQGDSGGPLVCEVSGVWYLAGIVSWGDGCAEANRPGVYTLVPTYRSWIQQQMNGSVSGACTVLFLHSLMLLLLLLLHVY